MAVRRIGDEAGVAGHPFVDENVQRRGAVVVGCVGCGGEKLKPGKRLAVGERTVRAAGPDGAVVEIIEHMRLAENIGAGERERAGACAQSEGRVQFGGGGLVRLAVGEDDLELPGVNGGTWWEGPLGE